MATGIIDESRTPRQQGEAYHGNAVHDLEPGLEAQHGPAVANAHAGKETIGRDGGARGESQAGGRAARTGAKRQHHDAA